MNQFFTIYISLWATACLASIIILIKDRKDYTLFQSRYWQFLLKPWKVVSFIAAAVGLTVIAPYTGDPTWDYVDALFMSVLTFTTAPWVVGTIYKIIKREIPLKQLFAALCIWMFSASWSYDLYILLRDGVYPVTWSSNISASSVLYIAGGLLWSLGGLKKKNAIFSFMEPSWPSPDDVPAFSGVMWVAFAFMLLVGGLILKIFIFI